MSGQLLRSGYLPSDQPSDALRIRAVQRLGVSLCLTRSAGLPIRVERRQKAKMITYMSRGACTEADLPGLAAGTDYFAHGRVPPLV